MKQSAANIQKLFQTSKTIALIGHINPDGDCIGSILGLGKILEKQGKKISYFTPSTPSKMFDFLPNFRKIKTTFDYKKYDLIIFTDFSAYDRITPFTKDQKYFDDQKILVIDHHPGNPPKHTLVYKDTHSMSTAEIIFELAQKIRKKYLDKEIATCFYLGLMTDSGNFLFDEDHERIFRNALALVKLGADKTLINNKIIREKSVSQIKFLGELIKRVQIQWDVLFSYYKEDDLKKYRIDQEEAGYGLVVIQNIQGPRLTLMLKKFSTTIRWSLRSKESIAGKKPINCNTIAKQFGGGGHPWAAWFEVPIRGNFAQQMKIIVRQINRSLTK